MHAAEPRPAVHPVPVPGKAAANPLKGVLQGTLLDPSEKRRSVEPTTLLADPMVRRRLAEAEQLAGEARVTQALALVQKILDEPDDSFVPGGEGEWQGARRAAEQVVLGLGPPGIRAYRAQYGDQAAALLAKGVVERDIAAWGDVLRRFFLTEAGMQAANLLASYQLDHGRPGLALVYLDRILESPAHREQAGEVIQAKRAVALAMLGRTTDAEMALARLAHPVLLGGRQRDRDDLLGAIAPAAREPPRQTDWPLFGGHPRRSAVAEGGVPLLAADWSLPTLLPGDTILANFLREVAQVNASNRRLTCFGLAPITVRDRIVMREYQGTVALDTATGRVAWRNFDPEGIAAQARRPGAGLQAPAQLGAQATFANNSVYGSLATDGERIYQVDHLALNPNPWSGGNFPAAMPAARWNNRPVPGSDKAGRSRLVALDPATGKIVWELGGNPASDGELFFFGPPLPVDKNLFALVEQKSEMRLLCLEPETGRVRWNQVLSMAPRRIELDPLRRTEAAHLAYDQGILLCPTNPFRIVAMDPLTRTLLWHYSFADDSSVPQGSDQNSFAYAPAVACQNDPPMIADSRAIVSSSLSNGIHCIDLRSGKREWRVDRLGAQFVAGIFHQHVLLVAADHVRAVRLENGLQAWRQAVPVPSGRGVCVGDLYLLPTADARVVALEVATGRLAAEVSSRGDAPMGNLLASAGRVFSASNAGLEAFPLVEQIRTDANRLLAENPENPEGLFRRAQIALAEGQATQAIEDLLHALRKDRSFSAAPLARRLLFDVAAREGLEHAGAMDALVEELGQFATEPPQKAVYLRLLAENRLARKDAAAALAAVDAHAELSPVGGMLDAKRLVLREPRIWARNFLGRLFQQATPESLATITTELERRLDSAERLGEVGALDNLASMLATTPMASEANRRLGELLRRRERPGEAEQVLLRASVGDDGAAAQSLLALAELCAKSGGSGDSMWYLRELAERFPSTEVAQGKTGRALYEEAQKDPQRHPPAGDPVLDWDFEQMGVNVTRNTRPDPGMPILWCAQAEPPFFRNLMARIDQKAPVALFEMLDRQTGQRQWTASLPRSSLLAAARFDPLGHLLFFSMGDQVHALSALDKKVVWSRPMSGPRYGVYSGGPIVAPVYYAGMQGSASQVALAGPGFVAFRTGKDLLVVDPWTGRDLWSRRDIRLDQEVLGDSLYLFLVSRNDGKYTTYRTQDGEFLGHGALGDIYRFRQLPQEPGRRRPATGRNILWARPEHARLILRLRDPWTSKDLWERGFAASSRIFHGDDGEILVIEPEGKITVVDPRTGRVILTDQAGKELDRFQSRIAFFGDRARYYLAIDQGRAGGQVFYMPQANMVTRSVNGPLKAYNRESGKLLWSRPIAGQSIVTSPTEELPVLLTIGSRLADVTPIQKKLVMTIEILDKRTGKALYTRDRDDDNTPLTEVVYDRVGRWVELRSWSKKVRMEFRKRGDSAEGAGAVEEDDRPRGPAAPFLERMRRRNLAAPRPAP